MALLLLLVLSGCGLNGAVRTPTETQDPSRASPSAGQPVPAVPVSLPTPPQSEPQKPASDPAPEPGPKPAEQGPSKEPDKAPAKPSEGAESPSPAQKLNWRPAGIGLPLVTDDPAGKNLKVAMLTFDDGPTSAGHTAKVLDALKEHGARAVFFITGNGLKNRDLVERIHREGHVLGVHTLSHANLTKLTPAEMRKEIEPVVGLIQEVTGSRPTLFRPPYGAYNDQVLAVLKEYDLEPINWTNSAKDWEHREAQKVADEVVGQLHRGAVILMHDIKAHTAEALPDILKRIKAEGYEFIVMK